MSLTKAREKAELMPNDAGADSPRRACRECSTSTLTSMLVEHGGLCLSCYESYCRANQQGDTHMFTQAEKRDVLRALLAWSREPKDPRAWIGRLRAKQARGEPLSPARRHALTQIEARPVTHEDFDA